MMWPMLLHIFRMYVSIESNMHLNFEIVVVQLTIQSNMHANFEVDVLQLKTMRSNFMNIIKHKDCSISEYNNLENGRTL